MRDMAHSICLIKLYQITMRKKFQLFVSDHLKLEMTKKTDIDFEVVPSNAPGWSLKKCNKYLIYVKRITMRTH